MKVRGQLVLLFRIHFREQQVRMPARGPRENRRKRAAGATPWRPEIDHRKGAAVERLRKVFLGQLHDGGRVSGHAMPLNPGVVMRRPWP